MDHRWTRLGEKAEKTYKFVISYIFILILAALLLMASFSTTFIDKYEMPYFLPDSLLINLAFVFLVLFVAVMVFVCADTKLLHSVVERLERDETCFLRVRAVLLWGIWFLVSLWVVCTQVPATADQRFCLMAARALAERDFSAVGPVSYLYLFNNQIGWTMFLYALNRVFGELNYIAFQLINSVAIVLVLRELSMLAAMFSMSRTVQLLVIIAGVMFMPLMLYASFIYGTLLALLFSLAAIRLEIVFFRTGGWYRAVLSAFLVCFAVMLKMNYLIFIIAMLIYAAFELFVKSRVKSIILVGFVVLFYVAQSIFPTVAYERIRGESLPVGCSLWSWVTMGLQDGERPGWYNYYNDTTLAASDYDARKQEAWVKTDLKSRLKELWQDKDYARDFFVRKTASQWNEPSFQSVWISITRYQEDYGQDVVGVENDWPKLILSPIGNHTLTQYLNYLNFVILSGALLYTVLCCKAEHYLDSLILPMIFIGGFLFHLVWEAKGQYTLPYFVLLLPYTVTGYSEAARRLVCAGAALKNGGAALSINRKALAVNLMLFALAVLVLWYLFHGTLGSITSDSEAYYAYLAAHS